MRLTKQRRIELPPRHNLSLFSPGTSFVGPVARVVYLAPQLAAWFVSSFITAARRIGLFNSGHEWRPKSRVYYWLPGKLICWMSGFCWLENWEKRRFLAAAIIGQWIKRPLLYCSSFFSTIHIPNIDRFIDIHSQGKTHFDTRVL